MIALVPRWRLEVPPKQQRKNKGKDKPIRNQKVLKTLYEEGLLTDTLQNAMMNRMYRQGHKHGSIDMYEWIILSKNEENINLYYI